MSDYVAFSHSDHIHSFILTMRVDVNLHNSTHIQKNLK